MDPNTAQLETNSTRANMPDASAVVAQPSAGAEAVPFAWLGCKSIGSGSFEWLTIFAPPDAADIAAFDYWTTVYDHPALPPAGADIDAMVNKFLAWRLPDDFYPDAGISFTPVTDPQWTHDSWPVGTNLLTADQARAMFKHVYTAPHPDARDAAIARAYGYLWHSNNPDEVPGDCLILLPARAAYEARKELRDLMTHEQRGDGINTVREILTHPDSLAAIRARRETFVLAGTMGDPADDATLRARVDELDCVIAALEARPDVVNFRGETFTEARAQLVNVLKAQKSWLTGYAEAYVDDFSALAADPASSVVDDGARVLTCVHCGQEFPQGTAAWGESVLTEHISTCAKHPMRTVIADNARLRAALVGIVGESEPEALRKLAAMIAGVPASEADKAVTLSAIHALLGAP